MKRLKLLIFVFLIVGGILFSAQNAKAQTGYMISSLEVSDDTLFGYSATNIYDYNFGYYYDVGVTGALYDQNNNREDYGSVQHAASAQVYTRKIGAVRGQNYKLISYHTAYAHYIREDAEQGFAFEDTYGISGFAGDYSSPHEIYTTYSRELVNETIELGQTSVTLQIPSGTPPQLTSIDIDHGVPGGNPIQTLIRGSNLFGDSQSVQVYGPNGVTASIMPGQLPNNIEALEIQIQIAPNALLGDRSIGLTVDGKISNNLTFHVGDRTPTITSINPSELGAGESAQVTITGTNFGTNPTLSVDCCGVHISQSTVNADGTQIQVVFSVDSSSTEGIRNVTVTSNGISGTQFQGNGNPATSNSVGFNVRPIAVFFQLFQIVGKGSSRNVAVTILPSNHPVTLTLVRANSSSGDARFANNSYTMQLNQSGTVQIFGITESSAKDDIFLTANASNAPSQPFSVALVKINRDNPQDGTNQPTPITDLTTTTIVGKRIKLSSQIVPSGLFPSDQLWIIPPTAVNDFLVSPDQQTGQVIGLSGLNTPQISFAWVDGGGATVNDYTTKEVDFAWQDNDYALLGKTTFHVTRPVAHVVTAISKTSLEITSAGMRLIFADGNIDGIQFNSTASLERPAGLGGYTRWVQIVNRSNRDYLSSTLTVPPPDHQDGLDGCYPYKALGSPNAVDNPNTGFVSFNFGHTDTVTVNVDDAYTMWLMFQPSSPESIAVPLKKVDWVWNAEAEYSPKRRWTFSGTSNTSTPNPVFIDTTDFPIWTKLVPDLTYHCPPVNP